MIKKILLLICLITCMTLIFIFSSQNGTVSGNLSGGITHWIAERIISGFDDMTQAEQIHTVESMHFFIRKLAHFSVYALLGLLSYLNISQYTSRNNIRIISSLLFCLIYASSDEFHQLFTDDRCGSPVDVLLDFSGALCGVFFILLVTALFTKLRHNKKAA